MLRIHFRPKTQRLGNKPYLYCRLRLNGVAATDFSTGIESSNTWDQSNQRFKGTSRTSQELNNQLAEISNDIRELLSEHKRKNPNLTATQLRNAYVKREKQTLLYAYHLHESDFVGRIGQPGYTKGTLKAHTAIRVNMEKYLAHHGRKDIRLSEVDANFGRAFVQYLRQVRKFKQNHLVRNLNHLRAMLDLAVDHELLHENLLTKIVEKKQPPGPVVYLKECDISKLKNSPLLTEGQQRVADCFLFVCTTGLGYSDLAAFRQERDIVTDQGRRVIVIHRTKSTSPCFIPLLKSAEELLTKYDGKLPVISNQKMNECLKEIASAVGINVHLTTHVARKTAGTFLLNADVPIKTVSRILGHKSVLTTEKIYAHLHDETILRHTAHLV